MGLFLVTSAIFDILCNILLLRFHGFMMTVAVFAVGIFVVSENTNEILLIL
jgi:hypothetical protein